jgi:hypothetical protein
VSAGLRDAEEPSPRDVLYVLGGDAFVQVETGFDGKTRERDKRMARIVMDRLC